MLGWVVDDTPWPDEAVFRYGEVVALRNPPVADEAAGVLGDSVVGSLAVVTGVVLACCAAEPVRYSVVTVDEPAPWVLSAQFLADVGRMDLARVGPRYRPVAADGSLVVFAASAADCGSREGAWETAGLWFEGFFRPPVGYAVRRPGQQEVRLARAEDIDLLSADPTGR